MSGPLPPLDALDHAILTVLQADARTADIAGPREPTIGTRDIGDEIARLVLWGKSVEPVLER